MPGSLKALVKKINNKIFNKPDVVTITRDDPKLPLKILVPKPTRKPKFEIRIPQWAGDAAGFIFVVYVGANYLKRSIRILSSILKEY